MPSSDRTRYTGSEIPSMIPVIAPNTTGTTTTMIASSAAVRSLSRVTCAMGHLSLAVVRLVDVGELGGTGQVGDPARRLVARVALLGGVNALGRVVAAPR